jgi:hypothetical protein
MFAADRIVRRVESPSALAVARHSPPKGATAEEVKK